jgi:Uma2 family endonuclease
MSRPLHRSWTQDEFFAWAEKQDRRYEFDGVQPVAMTGGSLIHGIVQRNLISALYVRLRGGKCQPLGPDNGVATIGKTIRYPDGLITCTKQEGNPRLISGVVVVFEVVSPSSSRMDRFVKVREYAVVASIRRYVLIESTSIDVTVMERKEPDSPWVISTLTEADILLIPEVKIEIPVVELYEGVTFAEEEAATS